MDSLAIIHRLPQQSLSGCSGMASLLRFSYRLYNRKPFWGQNYLKLVLGEILDSKGVDRAASPATLFFRCHTIMAFKASCAGVYSLESLDGTIPEKEWRCCHPLGRASGVRSCYCRRCFSSADEDARGPREYPSIQSSPAARPGPRF